MGDLSGPLVCQDGGRGPTYKYREPDGAAGCAYGERDRPPRPQPDPPDPLGETGRRLPDRPTLRVRSPVVPPVRGRGAPARGVRRPRGRRPLRVLRRVRGNGPEGRRGA